MSGGSGGGDATHVRRESDLRSELVLSPPKRMQSIMLPATAQGDGRMNVTNYSEVSVVFFLDTMASVWAWECRHDRVAMPTNQQRERKKKKLLVNEETR